MTTCPQCLNSALGTEAAAVCGECLSVSAAGATVGLPAIMAAAAVVAVVALATRSILRRIRPSAALA